MFNNLPKIKFAPENEGGAAATTFENTSNVATDDITAVLHFDPFKKGEEIPEGKTEEKTETPPAKKAKEGKSEAGDEKTNIPAKDAKASTSTKSDSEAKSGDQAEYWRGIAEARQEQLNKASKPVEEKKEEGIKIPEYNFDVPDKLVEALTSSEVPTFKKGVQALIQGMAGAVHAQMIAHVQEMYNPRFESVPAMIMQTLQAQAKAKAVSDDFYGKYPQFNHPQLKNLVKQTGEVLAKKLGKTDWDEELRDAIANEMTGILSAVKPQQEQSKPPRMLSSSSARVAPAVDDVSKDIADTIFGNF